MEKLEIFKLLLDKNNFNEYRHKLDKAIFPEILWDLVDALYEAHTYTTTDVTLRDVWNVYLTANPTLTTAKQNVVKDILAKINEVESITPEIASHVVAKAMIELKATTIAQKALEIAHGKHEDWSELQRLLDTDVVQDDISLVTTDLSDLNSDISRTYKWRFNLAQLNEFVGPIGPEVFAVLAGPVNSGKSLMAINFVFGPGGFAEQGAKCLYIGNEESLKRTMMRGACCYTGMTKDEIAKDTETAQEQFNHIKDNVYLIDDISMNFNKLNHIVNKLKPDIVVMDMLDKVSITGSFQRGDEKLARIYEQARELAKKHQCAVFGLSQTNAETFGKLVIGQNELANSRVDKAANADLVLTLGQLPSGAEEDNLFRQIYIAKSKLEGNDKKVNCRIIPKLSRLVA